MSKLSSPTGKRESWTFAVRGKSSAYRSNPHRTWFFARVEAAQVLGVDPADLVTVRSA